jgi:hypothetical protein
LIPRDDACAASVTSDESTPPDSSVPASTSDCSLRLQESIQFVHGIAARRFVFHAEVGRQ